VDNRRLCIRTLQKSVEKNERDAITKRLDAIIRLLVEDQVNRGKVTKGSLMLQLTSCGLSTAEIAQILGRASKDVASDLRKLKGS
jgi:DNA-directed RNA polymerase specialized sigma24 family protein